MKKMLKYILVCGIVIISNQNVFGQSEPSVMNIVSGGYQGFKLNDKNIKDDYNGGSGFNLMYTYLDYDSKIIGIGNIQSTSNDNKNFGFSVDRFVGSFDIGFLLSDNESIAPFVGIGANFSSFDAGSGVDGSGVGYEALAGVFFNFEPISIFGMGGWQSNVENEDEGMEFRIGGLFYSIGIGINWSK